MKCKSTCMYFCVFVHLADNMCSSIVDCLISDCLLNNYAKYLFKCINLLIENKVYFFEIFTRNVMTIVLCQIRAIGCCYGVFTVV